MDSTCKYVFVRTYMFVCMYARVRTYEVYVQMYVFVRTGCTFDLEVRTI
jgi:hypothetical protein